MDKVLGQEYANPQERTAFLRDNCDAVEELGYVKSERLHLYARIGSEQ